MNNRVIKFRAWDIKGKIMLDNVSTGTIIIWGDDGYQAKAKDCEFMQFTGLLDKNGKEIFEGDIVYIKKDKFGKGKNEVWSIEWDECDGCWVVYNQLNSHRKFVLEDRDCPRVYITEDDYFYPEVKGNVFENENLLK